MSSTLDRLGIALQAKAFLPQQCRHGRRRHPVAAPDELVGRVAQALGRPPQRATSGRHATGLDQSHQCRFHSGIGVGHTLATTIDVSCPPQRLAPSSLTPAVTVTRLTPAARATGSDPRGIVLGEARRPLPDGPDRLADPRVAPPIEANLEVDVPTACADPGHQPVVHRGVRQEPGQPSHPRAGDHQAGQRFGQVTLHHRVQRQLRPERQRPVGDPAKERARAVAQKRDPATWWRRDGYAGRPSVTAEYGASRS